MTGSPWTLRFAPRPAAATMLVCIPGAGGGASAFRAWSRAMPAWIECVAVQIPGRESRFRERPERDLAAVVRGLADVLAAEAGRPFALFGHSLGGLIAYEVTRDLERRDCNPAHLFVAACPPPHARRLSSGLEGLGLDELIVELRRRGDTPRPVLENRELMAELARILAADLALAAAYSFAAGQLLRLPLTVLGGVDDAEVPVAGLARWSELTRGPCAVRRFPGRHFFTNTSREAVLRAIVADLARSGGAAAAQFS